MELLYYNEITWIYIGPANLRGRLSRKRCLINELFVARYSNPLVDFTSKVTVLIQFKLKYNIKWAVNVVPLHTEEQQHGGGQQYQNFSRGEDAPCGAGCIVQTWSHG